jgi:hypothetical protein
MGRAGGAAGAVALGGLAVELTMWSIDRVGQKVQCVAHPDVWQAFCCNLPWPAPGEIFTVSGFAEIESTPGLYLYELPPVSCECHQLQGAPWPAACFAPLDQHRTDIGELTKLLTPIKEDA